MECSEVSRSHAFVPTVVLWLIAAIARSAFDHLDGDARLTMRLRKGSLGLFMQTRF